MSACNLDNKDVILSNGKIRRTQISPKSHNLQNACKAFTMTNYIISHIFLQTNKATR